MLTEDRYNKILLELYENGSASVTELTKITDASESTVRRDITALAKIGKLKKVRGGAMSAESGIIKREMRRSEDADPGNTERIAKYAASVIEKDDFVFIDGGEMTEKMIAYISVKGAKFVTNSLHNACLMARRGLRVYMPGGEVRNPDKILVGTACIESIGRYNFTKSFLETSGISTETGFTTEDIDEADVKRAAVNKSLKTYILAGKQKFGRSATVTFANMQDACIITEKMPNDRYKDVTVIMEVGE